MNFNPPYYQSFFEEYGFKVFYEQYVFWRDLERDADEVFQRKANILWNDPKFKITDVADYSDKQLAEYFLGVYNEAWGKHEGFKPMKFEQAHKIMKAIKPVKDVRISLYAFYDNKPILKVLQVRILLCILHPFVFYHLLWQMLFHKSTTFDSRPRPRFLATDWAICYLNPNPITSHD